MRRQTVLCAVALLTAMAAHADDEPVPAATKMFELPAGAKIRLTQPLRIGMASEYGFMKEIKGPLLNSDTSIRAYNGASIDLYTGQTLLIRSIKDNKTWYTLSLIGDYALWVGPSRIATVGEFNRAFDGIFTIVWNDPDADPFPGMPDEVKQDLLMTRVLSAIKDNKHAAALPDFARLEKLGVKHPESFYYYHVVSLDKAGRTESAKSRGAEFLKTYGKKSKYYNDVLAIVAK